MQFDFGSNWAEFSARALTPERVSAARREFAQLMAPAGGVRGKSFLDIGFGQGLTLLSAATDGARAAGVDISPTCGQVLERNRALFADPPPPPIPVVIGSILDARVMERVRDIVPAGGVDVVHSWGVLHHTGDMDLAVRNAASLVRPEGYFVIAIYNRHWSSRPWLVIKYLYCKAPRFLQKMMVALLYPVIYVAKLIVTHRDPARQQRGMDFFYNVVDWVGGYPYEYASREEMTAMVESLGFRAVAFVPAEVPTGCNEFVFQKRGAGQVRDTRDPAPPTAGAGR